jgi:hypothetical protein
VSGVRGLAQLEKAVEDAREAHTGAIGRLLAAEARHDKARTSFMRGWHRGNVLRAVAEARITEDVYRGAQLDLALMRWETACEDARRLQAVAQRAVDTGKGPETINKAWEAADAAFAAIAPAQARVEAWKPVPR